MKPMFQNRTLRPFDKLSDRKLKTSKVNNSLILYHLTFTRNLHP